MAECLNLSDRAVTSDFRVFRANGDFVNKRVLEFKPHGTVHIILNEFIDSAGRGVKAQYGTYSLQSENGIRAIYCQTMTYKLRSNGGVEFVFATPNATYRGKAYGLFNTYSPSANESRLTANWLTLQNLGENPEHFRVEMHFANQVVEQEVTIAPNSRFDLALGHQLGFQSAGYYVVRPRSDQAYRAYLSRFGTSSAGTFAFQQELSDPLRQQTVAVSTTANALNWLSFANPHDEPVMVALSIRDESGVPVYENRSPQPLAAGETRHLLVNTHLDPGGVGKVGTVELKVLQQGKGVLVESGFYGRSSQNLSAIRWAYATKGIAPRYGRSRGKSRIALVNTFLDAANWLKMSASRSLQRTLVNYRADGVALRESSYTMSQGASLDLPLHEQFGPQQVGFVKASGYLYSESTSDHLLRVYYQQDGSIATIAPVQMPLADISYERRFAKEFQIPTTQLFQNSFLLRNTNGQLLTEEGSEAGRYIQRMSTREFMIFPKRGVENGTLSLRFPLLLGDDFTWTFSSHVHFNGGATGSVRITGTAYEKDSQGNTLRRKSLPSIVLEDLEDGFVNWSVGNVLPETRAVIFFVTIKSLSASRQFVNGARVIFKNPLLLRKRKALQPGVVLNYIDGDTIYALNKHHEAQLEQLFNAGHRLWVIGHRSPNQYGLSFEETAQQNLRLIDNNPSLRDSKFVVSGQRIFPITVCDIAYYQNRNGATFDYPAVYRDTIGARLGFKPEGYVVVRENCVDPEDTSDPRHPAFVREMNKLFTLIEMYQHRIGGIYLMDEASSHGLPVPYLEKIYQYISSRYPSVPIFLTNSFYIGSNIRGNFFSEEISKRYFSPTVADVMVVDYYTIPALQQGDTRGQTQFISFLEEHSIMSKPFVRLLGTTLNSLAPCLNDKDAYTAVLDLAMSLRNKVARENTENWQNLGFWAFFNKEARSDVIFANTTWDGTMAWQENNYCESQFNAVLSYSRQFRF